MRHTADVSPKQPIRVVVAEDSYLIRVFLSIMLESAPEVELLAVCSNGKELEAELEANRPDVVVTDIRMPPSGAQEGIRLAARLGETNPEIRIIVLSQYAEPAYALALLENGSGKRGYLLKERIRDRDELIAAIATVDRGGLVIDPKIVDLLIQARARAARSRLAALTPRELELLVLTKRAVEKHVIRTMAEPCGRARYPPGRHDHARP